jgi:hypothetical protein
VFQLTTAGALTTLHAFTGGYPADDTTTVQQNPQVDGAGPRALVQTSDGSFWGIQEGGDRFSSCLQDLVDGSASRADSNHLRSLNGVARRHDVPQLVGCERLFADRAAVLRIDCWEPRRRRRRRLDR